MQGSPPLRALAIRQLIEKFLTARLNDKLDKLNYDDPKRAELAKQFQIDIWLADAARRAAQIQAVTHTLKAIQPDAKGSSYHAPPSQMMTLPLVGSHCLGEDYELDVVGNAAALDVYKFLRLEYEGRILLDLAVNADSDLATALSADPAQAQKWMQDFAGLLTARGKPSSHSLAKQLYWPVANDVQGDANFHLLEPLYASTLAQRVYEEVQADRFSDEAKNAREAKKTECFHPRPVRTYPDLCIQQLGGTKPQNISQLNSQRRGNNFLFASLPPRWVSDATKPLLNGDSMFVRFSHRPEVNRALRHLIKFLNTDPDPTKPTRDQRSEKIEVVIDEFLVFTGELRELPEGWTSDPACQLPRHQAYWLDPQGAQQADLAQELPPPTDVLERVSEDFARWLNQQLRVRSASDLSVADPEYFEWRKLLRDALKGYERGDWMATTDEEETHG